MRLPTENASIGLASPIRRPLRRRIILHKAVIGAAAAFLACAAAASAQPVTASTTCSEFRDVNPEFLTNIMVMGIQAEMHGWFHDMVQNADWLNRFVGVSGGRIGDAGVANARSIQARSDFAFGGGRESDVQTLAIENRARAKAESLLPVLAGACNATPDRPLLNFMASVLFHAGYGRDPDARHYVPSPSPPIPSPKADAVPNGAATSSPYTAFQAGLDARRGWEQWFAGLSGDYRAGAAFWASQRSLPKPGSCRAPDGASRGEFTDGCEGARGTLMPSDYRKRSQPEFKQGWNSLPVGD
jgi:hypothetical protein